MGQAVPKRSVGKCLLCSVFKVTAVQQNPRPPSLLPAPSTCKIPHKTVFTFLSCSCLLVFCRRLCPLCICFCVPRT